MSTLALVHPSGLLGIELRESLDRRRDLWQELRLLSDDPDEIGNLTEVRGAAAMVSPIEDDSFEGVDVAFFCAGMDPSRAVLERLPPATAGVLLALDAGPDHGHPIVAGVNLETATRDRVLLSPHPGAILLAHLLHPLARFRPRRATATLLQPVSVFGKEGLDEVFEQTRGILSFDPAQRREIFPYQLAFNMTASEPVAAQIEDHLGIVLQRDVDVSTQIIQTAVFHGYGVSLHLELEDDPDPEEIREILGEHPCNDLADEPRILGPINAAGRSEVLVGAVEADVGRRGACWIWAVMDNLTCGGALNAIQILEAIGNLRTQ